MANQFWEDEWSASGPREYRKPGATVDNAGYVAKPYYHRVRNEDQRAFHVVAVINERALKKTNTAPGTAGDGRTIDNAWFREHRLQVAPGSNSNTLTFDNDVVLVQPVAGSSHILENDIAHNFKGAPAAFSWHRAGSEFRIANRSDSNLEFVLLEVKE